jgi:hypothetical protein
VDPGAAHLHRKEGNDEEAPAGVADVVGQAAARSAASAVGGVLRAAVLRSLPRVPPRPRVSHRPAGDHSPMARDGVVHRGRRHRLFRVLGPLDHEIDPGREDPRRPVTAPDRGTTPGGIPGGLAIPPDVERLSARRCGVTRPLQHLPGPAGSLHRADPVTCPQSGNTTHASSAVHAAMATRLETGTARRLGSWSRAAQADEDHALPRPRRSGLPAAALLPLRGRLAARVLRSPAGSRADQGSDRPVPARSAQAGAVTDQDLDHPRADLCRPVPRLRHCGVARRPQARSSRSPQYQRGDRVDRAGGDHPRQVCALSALRQTDPAHGTHRRH